MAANWTKFVHSAHRLVFCHAYTVLLSLPAVLLRPWILLLSLHFLMLSWSILWRSPMVPVVTCITIMRQATPLVKLVASVLQVVVKLATVILPSVHFFQYFQISKSSHTPFAQLPKLCLKTVQLLWRPLVLPVSHLWMPACQSSARSLVWPWVWCLMVILHMFLPTLWMLKIFPVIWILRSLVLRMVLPHSKWIWRCTVCQFQFSNRQLSSLTLVVCLFWNTWSLFFLLHALSFLNTHHVLKN